MMVYLINPKDEFLDKAGDRPPLGLGALSAYLKQHGHLTKIIDMNHEPLLILIEDGFTFQIGTAKPMPYPDFFCISVSTPNYKQCIEIAKDARLKFPHTPIIAGGNHVSAYPDEPLTLETFDYVVTGTDGEEALLRIVEGKV